MSQQPDTYNIIEIKCMDSDAIRLFVDKAEYEKQAARIKELEQDIQTTADALAEVEQIRLGLQNVRLFAARHRKEDWALMILGFCAEAGEVGSITR